MKLKNTLGLAIAAFTPYTFHEPPTFYVVPGWDITLFVGGVAVVRFPVEGAPFTLDPYFLKSQSYTTGLFRDMEWGLLRFDSSFAQRLNRNVFVGAPGQYLSGHVNLTGLCRGELPLISARTREGRSTAMAHLVARTHLPWGTVTHVAAEIEDLRQVTVHTPTGFMERRQDQIDMEIIRQLRDEAVAKLGVNVKFLPDARIEGLRAERQVGDRHYLWTSDHGGSGRISHTPRAVNPAWLQAAAEAERVLAEQYSYTGFGMFRTDFQPWDTSSRMANLARANEYFDRKHQRDLHKKYYLNGDRF